MLLTSFFSLDPCASKTASNANLRFTFYLHLRFNFLDISFTSQICLEFYRSLIGSDYRVGNKTFFQTLAPRLNLRMSYLLDHLFMVAHL